MFEGIRVLWRFLRALVASDTSYSVMVVPDDGSEMSNHRFSCANVKKIFNALSMVIALMVISVSAVYYIVYTGWADRDALREYYASREAQDKRIEELRDLTDHIQQELATVRKLKKEVVEEMKKAGMDAPALADESEYRNGQGGPMIGFGDRISTKIKVLEEQNNNLAFNMEIDKQDVTKLKKAIHQANYKKEVTPDIWPVDNGWVTSEFGRRQDPVTGAWGDFHPGLDIAAEYGEPIYATASGRVVCAGWYTGYGKYVEIEHDFGYSTAYGHMSEIKVNVNGYVVKGQLIGRVGSTGYSTGPHLHYEVILWGEQINPKRVIK